MMALVARITLSNNNPQSGQSITASAVVSGQSGAVSYQWKLGSSNIPGATNSSYVYSLSDGDNTVSCLVTDSSETVTASRSVFVGKLDGANSVAKGSIVPYTTNIPNAKWSIQGSSNVVTLTENYIDASGKLYGNKAQNIVVQAESRFWGTQNSAFALNSDDTLTVVSPTYQQQPSAVTIFDVGDYFEVIFSDGDAWISSDGTIEFQTFTGTMYADGRNQSGSFAMGEGVVARLEIVEIDGVKRLRTKLNGVTAFTNQVHSVTTPIGLSALSYSMSVGKVFNRPMFGGNGISNYKLATKSVPVYAAAVADFAMPATVFLNQSITPTNNSIAADGFEWDFGNDGTIDSISAAPNIIFNTLGEKEIKLRAYNAYTSDVEIKSIIVIPPALATSYSPNSNLVAPVKIQFTDISPQTVQNPCWDFGDYAKSDELSPAHTFLAPGVYKIARLGEINGYIDDDVFEITIGGTPPVSAGGAIVFDEIELPRYYTEGATGGPEFSTSILGNPQGLQQRNSNRYNAVHKYEINFDGESYEDAEFKELLDFFYTRHGAGIGFRFFPHYDNRWNNERIAATNPAIEVYPLIRTYKKAGREYIRRIVKPVPELVVTINNFDADYYSAYTVDYLTGRITFASPQNLPQGGILRVTGEYCVPVTFSTDKLDATGYSTYADLQGLQVVELLPAALGIND